MKFAQTSILIVVTSLTLGCPAQTAGVDNYCVLPVPVVEDPHQPLSPVDGAIVSRLHQTTSPRYVQKTKGASFPLVFDLHTAQEPDGEAHSRKVFWSFDASRRLVGPHAYDFSLNTDLEEFVSNRSGTTLLVGGAYERSERGAKVDGADGKRWQTRLFEIVSGSAPKEVSPDLQRALGSPREVFWSDVLNGFLVSSVVKTGSTGLTFRSNLLRNGRVTSLQDVEISYAADLPRYGVAALLGSGTLDFVDPEGNVSRVARVNAGDDYGGWEALHDTQDEGWIYVDGVQYDNALRLEKENGAWRPPTSFASLRTKGFWTPSSGHCLV